SVVAVAAWRLKPWWVTTPYPRLRCLVIPIPSSWFQQFLAARNCPLFLCLTQGVHSTARLKKHYRKRRKYRKPLRADREKALDPMHVLATELATLDEVDVAVDLGQSPAEIVVLSFSDSDLSALAAAWQHDADVLPTLRLASLKRLKHPMS